MATYVETSLQVKWERRNDLQHHMRKLEAIRRRALPQRESPVVLLVQRLMSISTRKRADQQRSFSVSLQKYVKRRKWDQIFAENQKLSQKLGKVSSDLSKRRQELSFHEMERYKQLTSKARRLEMAERITRTRFTKAGQRKPQSDSTCDMVL